MNIAERDRQFAKARGYGLLALRKEYVLNGGKPVFGSRTTVAARVAEVPRETNDEIDALYDKASSLFIEAASSIPPTEMRA